MAFAKLRDHGTYDRSVFTEQADLTIAAGENNRVARTRSCRCDARRLSRFLVALLAITAISAYVADAGRTAAATQEASSAATDYAVDVSVYVSKCSNKLLVNECVSRAAMQARSSGRKLYFPAGVYPLSAWEIPCPMTIVGDGEARTILERPAGSAGNVISANGCGGLRISNLTIDGNRTSNSSVGYTMIVRGSSGTYLTNVEIKNSKGAGSALTIQDSRDDLTNTSSVLSKLHVHDNDGNGIYLQHRAWNWTIGDSIVQNNGGIGINVIDYEFPPKHAQFGSCTITRNNVSYNKGNGISLTSEFTGGTPALPVYGPFDTIRDCRISNNQVNYNGHFGIIVAGGFQIDIGSNQIEHNGTGTSNTIAGINSALCEHCDIHDNTSQFNDFYGIDAGGAFHSTVQHNSVANNGNAEANNGNGINCGACRYVAINDNVISRNGWAGGGAQIHVTRYDAGTAGFPFSATDISIKRNRIICGNELETGILLLADPPHSDIEDNRAESCQAFKGYVLHLTAGKVLNNRQDSWAGPTEAAPTNTGVYPDAADEIVMAQDFNLQTATLRPFFYSKSYQTVYAAIVTEGGSGYSISPTVQFLGGCDSEPTGSALQDNAGHIVGVNLTTFGAGCRTTPTITIEDRTGHGAVASAFVLQSLPINGRVIKVLWAPGLRIREGWSEIHFIGNQGLAVPNGSYYLSALQGENGKWRETERHPVILPRAPGSAN